MLASHLTSAVVLRAGMGIAPWLTSDNSINGKRSAGFNTQMHRSEGWVSPILLTFEKLNIPGLYLKELGKHIKFNHIFKMCGVIFTNFFQSQFITVISVRERY